jgi:hypothetical protein
MPIRIRDTSFESVLRKLGLNWETDMGGASGYREIDAVALEAPVVLAMTKALAAGNGGQASDSACPPRRPASILEQTANVRMHVRTHVIMPRRA